MRPSCSRKNTLIEEWKKINAKWRCRGQSQSNFNIIHMNKQRNQKCWIADAVENAKDSRYLESKIDSTSSLIQCGKLRKKRASKSNQRNTNINSFFLYYLNSITYNLALTCFHILELLILCALFFSPTQTVNHWGQGQGFYFYFLCPSHTKHIV